MDWARSGRGREAHQELEALGVKRPATTPIFYRVSVARLTTDDLIEATGEGSGGEVEFVLLQHAGKLWVGTGSDHTDREVEKYGVTVSKQMCEKPIAPVFWAYDDVAPHWDRLILRAHVVEGRKRALYQEGPVTAMMDPTRADRPPYRKWRRSARRHAHVLRYACRPWRRAAHARVRLRNRRSRARPQDRARLSGANTSHLGMTTKRLPEQNPCR
jgi:Protein of unknown function (DUF2848).